MLTKNHFKTCVRTMPVVCVTLSMLMLVACKGVVNITTLEEGAPVSAPVTIYANGEKVGTTDASGKITLNLDPGEYLIRAAIPSRAGAEMKIVVEAGQSQNIEMMLTYGYGREPASMVSPQIVNKILPIDFTEFELRIAHDYPNRPPLARFQDLEIFTARNDDNRTRLDTFFELTPQGTIQVTDIEGFRQVLNTFQPESLLFSVSAGDEEGGYYEEMLEFYLGRHKVFGQLAAPPSAPALPVSDITVRAHYMGDESIVFDQKTDALGQFELKNLIPGNWHFEIHTQYNDQVYFSFGSVTIDQDTNL